MRTELEFPIIDFSKIEEVKELIDAIAENMKDHSKELEKLNSITNKQHSAEEFAEYWEWTDLDILAQVALTPEPPCIRDLEKEEIATFIKIIKESFINGEDNKTEYYVELLHKSLPIMDVMGYIMTDENPEVLAEKMIAASLNEIIIL
ncbi:MAG: hypothetical protein K2N51_06520 [Lachnospiraceae bacterium]|nr:hypothetical protein [Lachnospiraceae bacterium]